MPHETTKAAAAPCPAFPESAEQYKARHAEERRFTRSGDRNQAAVICMPNSMSAGEFACNRRSRAASISGSVASQNDRGSVVISINCATMRRSACSSPWTRSSCGVRPASGSGGKFMGAFLWRLVGWGIASVPQAGRPPRAVVSAGVHHGGQLCPGRPPRALVGAPGCAAEVLADLSEMEAADRAHHQEQQSPFTPMRGHHHGIECRPRPLETSGNRWKPYGHPPTRAVSSRRDATAASISDAST